MMKDGTICIKELHSFTELSLATDHLRLPLNLFFQFIMGYNFLIVLSYPLISIFRLSIDYQLPLKYLLTINAWLLMGDLGRCDYLRILVFRWLHSIPSKIFQPTDWQWEKSSSDTLSIFSSIFRVVRGSGRRGACCRPAVAVVLCSEWKSMAVWLYRSFSRLSAEATRLPPGGPPFVIELSNTSWLQLDQLDLN